MLLLERCGYGEAEGFSWFPQRVGGAQSRLRQGIRVVASAFVSTYTSRTRWTREHAAVDLYGRCCAAVEAQGIVGVVNAEGRIDDRKHGLQFDPGGHSHNPVGARNRAEIRREGARGKSCSALTGETILSLRRNRAAELRAYQGVELCRVDLQL